jgi:hypothetical protein
MGFHAHGIMIYGSLVDEEINVSAVLGDEVHEVLVHVKLNGGEELFHAGKTGFLCQMMLARLLLTSLFTSFSPLSS